LLAPCVAVKTVTATQAKFNRSKSTRNRCVSQKELATGQEVFASFLAQSQLKQFCSIKPNFNPYFAADGKRYRKRYPYFQQRKIKCLKK